jgi:SAM-dependent methyltransferase
MNQPGLRFWEIFFEVYEHLPRQGPGNCTCAARALGLCRDLRESPAVLDLGCGVGGQTLQLAELTSGSIVAIDSHPPNIERLEAAVAERGLAQRIHPIVGDMARPGQPLGVFDLIWSEGALYNIGLRDALRVCHGLLRPGGYLAFTDAVWRKENPPPEVKAVFDLDYPTMGWLDDDVQAMRDGGSSSLDTSPCPMKRGGRISLRLWKSASLSYAHDMPPMLKPWLFLTNSPRSLRCTAVIPTSMPMSSSSLAVLSGKRN